MKHLFLIAIVCSFFGDADAQEYTPTVGAVLRSLTGVDMMTGKVIDVEFRESKEFTLFHFWSTHADSSVKDFTALTGFVKRYEHKLTVYGFPFEQKEQVPRAKAIIKSKNINWAQLLQYRRADGQGANVIDVLRISEFPTYILLDREGVILVRSAALGDVEVVIKRME
jgi:hypothetical protein